MYKKELKTAIKAAKEAGKFLLEHRKDVELLKTKSTFKDIVTDADLGSEDIIVDMIKQEFPDDNFLTEEAGGEISKERLWIIDPLDGTRNYANGLFYFSVVVAFYDNGTKVGVVYAPVLGELFYATEGKGAFLNDEKLVMKNPDQALADCVINTGFWYYKDDELDSLLKIFKKVLSKATDVVRYGSAALDLCNVAAGRLGGFFEPGLKPWDVAAGSLIITEAGGAVSGYAKELEVLDPREGIIGSKNKQIMDELKIIINSGL